MNTFVRRVWSGAGRQGSRHGDGSRFESVVQLRHLPRSLGMKMATRLFGTHARTPGWPYTAMSALARVIQPDWRVLEFGSGWSTLWLADRCAEVISVESSPVWAAFVDKKAEDCVGAVRVIQRELEDYADTGEFADGSVDLCVIDGLVRDQCFESALRVVRSGGYIYLDSSEPDNDPLAYPGPGRKEAVQRMMWQTATETGGELREYRGLIVGEVFSGGGVLLRKGQN
jgi:predicted O-methyltransferase YrrM